MKIWFKINNLISTQMRPNALLGFQVKIVHVLIVDRQGRLQEITSWLVNLDEILKIDIDKRTYINDGRRFSTPLTPMSEIYH